MFLTAEWSCRAVRSEPVLKMLDQIEKSVVDCFKRNLIIARRHQTGECIPASIGGEA